MDEKDRSLEQKQGEKGVLYMYLYKYDKPRKEKNTGSFERAERYNFGMKVGERRQPIMCLIELEAEL